MFKEISKELLVYLQKLGINPIYFATILIIGLHIGFDYRNYKNWDKISNGQKFYVIVGLIASVVFVFFSLLTFIGVFH